jgi:thymidylate kinase
MSSQAVEHVTSINSQVELRDHERSQADFLCTFFRELDANGVCYCVLHSWEGLPDRVLSTDLDVAIAPKDADRLFLVIGALRRKGYQPVQCVNYSLDAYAFTFLWTNGTHMNSAVLDISFKHCNRGRITLSGDDLVHGRRRHGIFWVAGPNSEFAYLLSKKGDKGSLSVYQAQRLNELVTTLGCEEAETIASKLFGRRWGRKVVQSCADGSVHHLLNRLGRQLWLTTLKDNPIKLIWYFINQGIRLSRRWLHPTGVFVVLLGPDGAGKTTVGEYLTKCFSSVFHRQHVAHWRPGLLGNRKMAAERVTNPHALPPRGALVSSLYLFGFFLDDILGFYLLVRPKLVRTAWVLFDRYFQDILIDPRRYRCNAPTWLPQFLNLFVPPREKLQFVLDASEEAILARKCELGRQELCSQRQRYQRLIPRTPSYGIKVLKADEGLQTMLTQALEETVKYLAYKFQQQHGRWVDARGAKSEIRNRVL